ncbi:MAG: adenosylcobalamin-dependent ribonucleoside-diphosphate reductase, partial [Phycisphaerae bacterium]|nr:adenosylcobalamin-dependent ribonucleoside-diphosphate reductase [Phycisphaerae bacterium]
PHATGEPGVVFMDAINRANPPPHIGRIAATNPCGEQPLLPYEACNLGSVNLGEFVNTSGATPTVEWELLREAVHFSARFLDNVIDANKYPLPQIEAMCKANRKIGLGIMGFADALYKLGVGYNTDEGVAWGERFMKFINDESHAYSEKLAEERGCFPNWQGSTWDIVAHRKMRNAATTTVAPTGTISIIAGCSGGIEPMFSLAFYRNVLDGQRLIEVNDYFQQTAKACGFFSEELMDRIAKEGTLAHLDEVPDAIRRVFVCAHDIAPDWHMKQQAAFQRHCDASISKTINFTNDAQVEEVDAIYRMAYTMGCKGVTVYRDGCRKNQPMSLDNKDKLKKGAAAEAPAEAEGPARTPIERLVTVEPVPLPEIMSCLRIRQMTPFGNMHLKITVDPKTERELEVFAQLGKGGDVANSDLEAICRLLSLFLRCGGSLRLAIKQLDGIGSSLTVPTKSGRIASLGDGLAKGLIRYTRAKEMFGLKAMLLGEFDLALLDDRMRGEATGMTTRQAAKPAAKPVAGAASGLKRADAPPAKPGNGGNGGKKGNGHSAKESLAPRQEAEAPGGTGDVATAVAPALSRRQGLLNAFKLKCPECGSTLSFQEGCVKCPGCGYSQC